MHDWPRFIRLVLGASVVFALMLFAFIFVMDPYQNVPFSPPLARAPISTNQRFAYPALARNPAFDSVIIGTSTSRLLDPARLGRVLDARFVSLAMNSATATEQSRMLDLFARHHPAVRHLVLGIDETWCNRREHVEDYTFREFPLWMFDDSRWNDLLYLFNDKALENAVRMLELLLGQREAKYRNDGFRDFTLDFGQRSAAAVQARLYPGGVRDYLEVDLRPTAKHPEWRYPLLEQLSALVRRAGAARVVLFFPPLHARYASSIAENMSECKARVLDTFANAPQVAIIDYMHLSPLTRDDAHYWDPLHTTSRVARVLEADVARVLEGGRPLSRYARTLTGAGALGP